MDNSFWEFGKYDNPAMVNYIINLTGHDKITYMGHSEGTSSMMVSLSLNFGDLQSKLNLFIMMAPVTNRVHSSEPFFGLKNSWILLPSTWDFFMLMGKFDVFDPTDQTNRRKTWFCQNFQSLCYLLLSYNPIKSVFVDEYIDPVAASV